MSKDIFNEVVERNLCIGCGACAAVQGGALRMAWNDEGFFEPVRNAKFEGELSPRTLAVCPFNDDARDEDWIAEQVYGTDSTRDPYIGHYLKCFIGHCGDPGVHANATSGGIIGWAIRALLSRGLVDKVIALGNATENERLFGFKTYRSVAELDAPMKSRYYPSEFSTAVQGILDEPGTVLFVGLPCQVKAMRKIALEVPEVSQRLKYAISLFCGHQKSRHYAEYLALHVGVDPATVVTLDYRKKREGHPASAYGFEITYAHGAEIRKASGVTREVFASSWSNNLFMNPACEFCDDVVGETADLSVGDAWLPGFSSDSRGTSICVVRHPELLALMLQAREASELSLEETTPETVYRSQEGGFRQRRQALQYRLALAMDKGRSVPRKRVTPSKKAITYLDRLQQRLRIRLRQESNRAFRRSEPHRDLTTFRRKLGRLHRTSEILVALRKLQRRLRALRR